MNIGDFALTVPILLFSCNYQYYLFSYLHIDLLSEFDLIKSTYAICDENNDRKLMMNEIHQDNCLDTLEKVFGLNKSVLSEVCSQIDTNNDMMISFEEASIAFHRSYFGDRSDHIWVVRDIKNFNNES